MTGSPYLCKMKRLYFIFNFIAIATALMAQQELGQLKGTITDDIGEPVIGASIYVVHSTENIGTDSGLDGTYSIALSPGRYDIEVNYIGSEPIQFSVQIYAGRVVTRDVVINASATLLQAATVTTSKYEKPLGEVTVSTELLSDQLIEAVNTVEVDDVLDKVPGVQIIDGQPNIRGGSGYSYGAGSRVLLLVDDLPALQGDAGFPNWGDIPVENIEQIEVVKGAASALYGSSAMNGIVNVRTRYARAEPETDIAVFGTAYSAPRDATRKWWGEGRDTATTPYRVGLQAVHRQRFGKLDLVLGANYLDEATSNEFDELRRLRLNVGTRYRFMDKVTAGIKVTYNDLDNVNFFYWKNAEEGLYQANPGAINRSQSRRFFIDPFLTVFDEQGGQHKLLGRYYDVDNGADNGQSNQSQFYYGEYQYLRRWLGTGTTLTAGGVVNYTGVQAELYGDTTYTVQNQAIYAQLEQKWGRLNLALGARYERNEIQAPAIVNGVEVPEDEQTEARPVFRIGANYQAAAFTYLRASWGQGYRFPTIAEKFIATNIGILNVSPNPLLQSETGWTAELGVKQGFRIGRFEGFADVSVFWSRYFDMMEFTFIDFATGFQSLNIGDTDIKGAELSVAGRGRVGQVELSLLGGYTYIDPRYQEFGEQERVSSSVDYNILKYRFRHTGKLDVQARYRDAELGVAYFGNSEMEAIDAILGILGNINGYREANPGGFTILNLRAAYYVTSQLKMSFLVDNALNRSYAIRPGVMEPTRTFTLRADYRIRGAKKQ